MQAKVWLAILVLSALAGIGFMVFAMGHGTCIAELAEGHACANSSPLDYVFFHLTAWSVFSTAVFSGALALLLGLIVRAAAPDFAKRLRLEPALIAARSRRLARNFQSEREAHAWYSILEKRDPASF